MMIFKKKSWLNYFRRSKAHILDVSGMSTLYDPPISSPSFSLAIIVEKNCESELWYIVSYEHKPKDV